MVTVSSHLKAKRKRISRYRHKPNNSRKFKRIRKYEFAVPVQAREEQFGKWTSSEGVVVVKDGRSTIIWQQRQRAFDSTFFGVSKHPF